MARQTTLANALLMAKAQLAYSLTTGVGLADDQQLYSLIDQKQSWLSCEYDWPFLETRVDIVTTARYTALPALTFERPVLVEVLYTTRWQDLDYGIGGREYNYLDSDTAQAQDPIERWRLSDENNFEVWPVPVTPQKVRFTGQRVLTSLKNAGVFDSTKTLDLDDLLVVLFVAADILLRQKKSNAQVKLTEAQNRLNFLRGSYPTRDQKIVYGQGSPEKPSRVVPLTIVHG